MTTTPRPIALVLGANGRFGAAAVQAFADAGWTALAQARQAPASLPDGARHVAIDLADTAALADAAAGARVVVHGVNPPYTQWAAQVLPLARLGMDLAQRLNATFMLPGNVYNYGTQMPPLLREDTPQHAATSKGRIRIQLEAEMQTRTASGLRAVVIRAGDFFGNGIGSWLDLVIAKSLARGKLVYPGPLDVRHAWAYLPDLAQVFVAAASRNDLPAFTRLHFAGHTLKGGELLAVIERAARALSVAPAGGFRRAGMPWAVLKVGGLVVPMWREVAEVSYLWRVPHALDGSATRRLLGVLPVTDIDSAMVAALQALGFGRDGATTISRMHRA